MALPLPSYKDIIDLLKAGATIEAQEKIMELRQQALVIQEENIQLRTRVQELEARLMELENLAGDPCPRCRKRTWTLEHSQEDPQFGSLGGVRRTYKCTECGFTESILMTPSALQRSSKTKRGEGA